MLRKAEIEKEILKLQKRADELGLVIHSFLVKDERVITELEKRDIDRILKRPRKPNFVSPANYKGLKNKLDEDEYGRLFGIRFYKMRGK